jgi:hypothetical protein
MPFLFCPKCQTRLQLKSDPLQKGVMGWVRCPFCGEVFQIPPQDLDSFLPAPEKGAFGRRDPAVRLSRRPEDSREKGADPFSCRPVNPVRRAGRTAVFLLAGFFVLAAAGALAWNFKSPDQPAGPLEAVRAKQPAAPDYSADLLKGDLSALRTDALRFRQLERQVGYRGYETRIYHHLAGQLDEGSCRDISELRLYSEDTGQGLEMTAVCLNPRHKAAEIRLTWLAGAAAAEAAGEPGRLEIPLPD